MYYLDENGKRQSFVMGSYGIGVSRLMGVIAEHLSDDKGLVWPKNIAPYDVYFVSIGKDGSQKADELYETIAEREAWTFSTMIVTYGQVRNLLMPSSWVFRYGLLSVIEELKPERSS